MNDITELRAHLFEALRGLKNKDSPMDIDRAKAVSDVAKTIIDSARVEVDFMRVTGHTDGTGFIQMVDNQNVITNAQKATTTTVSLLDGARITRHVAK